MKKNSINLCINGVELELSAFVKEGYLPPLIALHGFGSSKEDYHDFILRSENRDRGLYAFDLPGLGQSKISNPELASIDFLVDLTLQLLDLWNLDRFHICGHSMGGLTALLVGHQLQEQVISFTNIEGNVAPGDTFMSRQIFQYPAKNSQEFFEQFMERTSKVEQFGYASYIAGAPNKISTEVVLPYLSSIYDHSNRSGLFEKFTSLSANKMFVHGVENSHLTYLPELSKRGVQVLSVPHASHFPMNTNPVYLFDNMSNFIQEAEKISYGSRF